jgi:hypothetical protein
VKIVAALRLLTEARAKVEARAKLVRDLDFMGLRGLGIF